VTGQECGNGVVVDHSDGWESQYCHMARGSIRVKPGDVVKAGDPLGLVGLSGQTEFPHLHFTIRHGGKIVDPFDPIPPETQRCAVDWKLAASLWTPAAQRALTYKAGVILNAGFAGAPITMEAVEAGRIAPPTAASPALLAYMRAIELEKGDVLELSLKARMERSWRPRAWRRSSATRPSTSPCSAASAPPPAGRRGATARPCG